VADGDMTLAMGFDALGTDDARKKARDPLNWLDGNSRWVVIGPQSGRIVTVANAFVDPIAVINRYSQSPHNFSQSSETMRAAQIIAAREFTRSMSQLGGR
jgi:hypothetical protein